MANEENKDDGGAAGGTGGAGAAGGTSEGGGAGAGGAAGAGGTAGAGAGAGTGGPAAGGASGGGAGGKGKDENRISIPTHEFKKRVRRDAEKLAMESLGVTLEEAKKIIAAREAAGGGAGGAAAAGGDQGAAGAKEKERDKERKERDRLERENARLKETADRRKRRLESVRAKAKGEVYQVRLEGQALANGILNEHVDFALDLLRKACAAVEEGKPLPEPSAFFASLKATRGYLFAAGAPPTQIVPVDGSTAAPESRVPGGGPPEGAKQGAKPVKPKSVDDMTDEEFKDYRDRTYQYRG